MAQFGVIGSKWLSFSSHGRFDASFWLGVTRVLTARGIDQTDDNAVKAVVREIETRNEFPTGHTFVAPPTHVECPKCLSWKVNGTHVSVLRTRHWDEEVKGVMTTMSERTRENSAQYACVQCGHEWEQAPAVVETAWPGKK